MRALVRIVYIFSLLSSLVLSLPLQAAMIADDLFPYAGFDFEWTAMKGNHDWRKRLPADYPGGNFYAGLRLFDLELEGGYDFTTKRNRHSKKLALKTRVRTDSWHIDLNGFLPPEFLAVCTDIEIMGSIGIGTTKASISARPRRRDADLFQVLPVSANRKSILRLGVGAQYMFENCMGIRGMIRWKNTDRFVLRPNFINQENGFGHKPCENAVTIAIGVFTYF